VQVVPGNESPRRGSFSPKTRGVYFGSSPQATAESCRLPPQSRVDCCYSGDATVQVETPPTASEFRGGITGVTLRPVSGADIVTLITDEHLLHGSELSYS